MDFNKGYLRMNTLLSLLLLISFSTFSNVIAILDSGVDYKHKELIDKMWTNPGEIEGNRRDDDKNGYRDDFYGWNFASQSSEVINYSYLGTFSDDPKKLIGIQSELLTNGFPSASMSCYCAKDSGVDLPKVCKSIDYSKIFSETQIVESDLQWVCSKRSDKKFSAELSKFGNFLHGTHVAHIASRRSPESKIMALKLIPTEIGEVTSWMMDVFKTSYKNKKSKVKKVKENNVREKLLTGLLGQLASAQTITLSEAFDYIKKMNVSVVNGSFGTPFEGIKMFSDNAFRVIFFRKPTKEESDKYARIYFKKQLSLLSQSIADAKDTLFVFAAGNSASDNDIYPSSPTNIDLDNVISVAATQSYKALASFSNYGKTTVDLGAPGVVIKAAIPSESHDEFIPVSGTSQASPFVAGVAAQLRLSNPDLSPGEVKKILMSTVDKKSFLDGRVKSNGTINEKRVKFVSKSLASKSIDASIALANSKIKSMTSDKSILPVKTIPGFMPDLSHDESTRDEMNRLIDNMAGEMVQRLR